MRRNIEIKDSCLDLQKSFSLDRTSRAGKRVMILVNQGLPDNVSQRLACNTLNICRNTLRSADKKMIFNGPVIPIGRSRQNSRQPRALSAVEKRHVLETLTNEDYCNQPPAEVYYRLLEQDQYLCLITSVTLIAGAKTM